MIRVNNRDFPWEPGMTVQDVMNRKNFTWPKIIVKVNGHHVEEEHFPTTVVNDGDDVQMLHLLAGG
ncbi:MAG: sulfur carrier protein ThiS [Sedimentibacter sp.]|uniref:sulfur carrier protein ThiS n=1 Tax=Sedimentibacter sp. TaxID=1960295 RepID=UPI0031591D93